MSCADFALLLGGGVQWQHERACAKRDEKFAAIVHSPPD